MPPHFRRITLALLIGLVGAVVWFVGRVIGLIPPH